MFLGFSFFGGAGYHFGFVGSFLALWFVENLLVFLATEHELVKRLFPRILLSLSSILTCVVIYRVGYLSNELIDHNKFETIGQGESSVFILAGWHLIAFIVGSVSINFNTLKKDTDNREF